MDYILKKSTSQRVRKSLMLMLIARPISALVGLVILVILSRALSQVEYGQYFAVWAMIEISILVSSVGLMHAAYRYVSATEWFDGRIRLNGPIWQLLALRFASLLFGAGVLYFLGSAGNFRMLLEASSVLIILIAGITVAEGVARFQEVLFDSMLFQSLSLSTVVARTIAKIFGIGYLFSSSELTLIAVLYVELIAAICGSVFGMAVLIFLYKKSNLNSEQQNEHLSISRVSRFILPAYFTQLLGTGYGPDSIKLIAGATAGTTAVATFGFSYSFSSVIQRYMPANILAGVFRPVFVAASKRVDASTQLLLLLNLTIKINWLFLLPALCFTFFAGTPLLNLASDGKYPQAGIISCILIIGMTAVAWHLCLSAYCLAKENSWPPLIATFFSLAGLPIAILLGRSNGAMGLAAAFAISETIWSLVCTIALYTGWGHAPRVDWHSILKLAGSAALSILAGYLLQANTAIAWWNLSILTPCIFFALAWWGNALSLNDIRLLSTVLPLHKISPFRTFK